MPETSIAEFNIHYVEQGSGEPLLIFPDNVHRSHAQEAEITFFSEEFRVLSFVYPGTGRSARDLKYQDEQELDLWNYWADLANHLLLEHGVAECYVLGAGSLIAVATRCPILSSTPFPARYLPSTVSRSRACSSSTIKMSSRTRRKPYSRSASASAIRSL